MSQNINYQGIEGDVWPLHLEVSNVEKSELLSLIETVDNHITTFLNYSVTDVSNDINFINRYVKACMQEGMSISVLLCETEKDKPLINISEKALNEDFEFIGFDYGYCGSDYYSCVNSDMERITVMDSLKL